ncbi:kynureninase [Chitinophagaceae bacterium LB-8]|uniref:Kynureninase n=1 Tax=Paraflavisolibacter caeni TaxID=2982496 RepID=A0A9X2XUZ0_9BACT|nr:kynureninase [Paraflavisolibacter caeni]MCU7549016.1 kynureninase [Paraflavisolibacter caeni]
MPQEYHNTLSFARQMDAEDPLQPFRKEFLIPVHENKEQVYFLGNSLGLQPKRARSYIEQVLRQWNQFGVEGFFTGDQPWLDYHDQLIHPLSSLVGARPGEVVVMNSLTVNLHLLLVSFYNPVGKRNKILCEEKAFPSDQYLLETHIRQRGLDPGEVIIEVKARDGESLIRYEDIITAIKENEDELALVFWGGVNYYSGQVFDIKGITQAAHQAGAIAGFDLAHAAGNIKLQLHDWNVDFASWCSYKYLNSGPGAIGGAYIHNRYHADNSINRFAGWWGNDKNTRFLMEKGFRPTLTAEGWQLSTPSPILYATHKAALEIFAEAGLDAVFHKGQQLSNYLQFILQDVQKEIGNQFQMITPLQEKGCQVSMLVPKKGRFVFDYLTKKGIFVDWREPDVIRLAPVPLYNKYEEIWQFGQVLKEAFLTFTP